MPHPGGVEGVKERRQKKRSFRCWKKEEEEGKGKGGVQRGREERSRDSGSCWKSSGLHPVSIRGKKCKRVLEEGESREGE